eukprot:TRINITY_DN10612_c0_g1_i2.p1 TRINITY_DN10612_c0_g1~~TRINITY_DN10612_c0_g1_i2.p1  ORF type:complete len:312 (-),score=39.58 TRINITY_DN10612_c0_g1_i2:138-1004(-)
MTTDSKSHDPSTAMKILIFIAAGATKPIAMAPVDCLKTNLQLGNPVLPMIKQNGLFSVLYRGVGPLSFQFALYYGGILGMDALLQEHIGKPSERSKLTHITLSLIQSFYGMGLMMHFEHEKINAQSGNSKAGFPLFKILNRYRSGNGHVYRYGTPALLCREFLFMVPINARPWAERRSQQFFAQSGMTSDWAQFIAKWLGTFSIFFVSGFLTNIPDSLNSHLKNDRSEIRKIGPLLKHEYAQGGVLGIFKKFSRGSLMRGLTVAISATATFVCVAFYEGLYDHVYNGS